MKRRRFLVLTTGFSPIIAGCSAGGDSGETPDSTPSAPASKSCPERPDPLTRSNVGENVLDFEEAYSWNEALSRYDEIRNIDQNLDEDLQIEEEGGGFLVYISEVFVGVSTSEAIADTEYTANYYVTEERTVRAESHDERVDPREEGNEVECRE